MVGKSLLTLPQKPNQSNQQHSHPFFLSLVQWMVYLKPQFGIQEEKEIKKISNKTIRYE
jgi:hypothetical protein